LQDSNTGDGKRGKLIKQLRGELSKKTQVAFFKTPDHLASLVGAAVEKWKQKVDARRRDQASRLTIGQLTAYEKIVVDKQIGQSRLLVVNDDICNAMTDIVVSSDDNYFTARDGVSKLLLDKLGPSVRRELEHYRSARFRQGQVAITTGGDWGRRAVIHAAVIDLDRGLYPTPEAVRTLTRRSLECAVALGAGSIAFPVLGGGYATNKHMSPSDCVNAMVTEMLAFIGAEGQDRDQLQGITLYIFNPKDNAGLPEVVRDTDGR
jgi:O-acetyl-ADP-ribose deacetylase (regulator of RNase III)